MLAILNKNLYPKHSSVIPKDNDQMNMVKALEQDRDKLYKEKVELEKKLDISKKIQNGLFDKIKTLQNEKWQIESQLKSLSIREISDETQQSKDEPDKKKKSKKNKKKKRKEKKFLENEDEQTSDKNNTEATDLSITDDINSNTIIKETALKEFKLNIIDSASELDNIVLDNINISILQKQIIKEPLWIANPIITNSSIEEEKMPNYTTSQKIVTEVTKIPESKLDMKKFKKIYSLLMDKEIEEDRYLEY